MGGHPVFVRKFERTEVRGGLVQNPSQRVCCCAARLLATLLMLLLAATRGAGQTAERRYLPDRSDEDWSFLKTAPKVDVWDRLKYIPLGERRDWFVTLSGEVRYRPEGFRVRSTATRAATIDNYLLQRYLFGADVHLGTRARVFAEVQSGIINGRLRSPRPTDLNTIDLHQGFLEWRQTIGKHQLTAKAGRHELALGSSRLISASPGLNVKRSFDGVGIAFRTTAWTFGGAAARLVSAKSGVFDDRADAGQAFWGAAAGRRNGPTGRGEIGAYYLGIDRDVSLYAQGRGPERRHTVGVKWTRAGSALTFNYDGLLQWGEFRDASIRAWAFATETTYTLPSSRWRPRAGIRADIASGDDDLANPRLQSFNPLFPGNAYSGAVGLLGPTNLTDLTPSFTVSPRRNLSIGFEAPSYWRTSTADGVYSTDLRLLVPPAAGGGTYVGTNPGVLVVWQATLHCQLQAVVTRFLSGGFLEDTFVSSGFGFYSASAIYRF